jgi:hypothetical protein
MAAPQLVRTGPSGGHSGGSQEAGEQSTGVAAPSVAAADGRSGGSVAVPTRRTVRAWPLMLPASVAVWSGWVGTGQLTGFGQVRPLPGIWSSLHIDTAVTLPIGVEAYAAYALHAWLATSAPLSDRTRRFAKWSAIGSLLLGMAGQVAYHLLTQAGVSRAPWGGHDCGGVPSGAGAWHGGRACTHGPCRRVRRA